VRFTHVFLRHLHAVHHARKVDDDLQRGRAENGRVEKGVVRPDRVQPIDWGRVRERDRRHGHQHASGHHLLL